LERGSARVEGNAGASQYTGVKIDLIRAKSEMDLSSCVGACETVQKTQEKGESEQASTQRNGVKRVEGRRRQVADISVTWVKGNSSLTGGKTGGGAYKRKPKFQAISRI